MKKFSVLLTLAVLMVSSSVFAGSIDYLSNQSAKYIMNPARTAATDAADIVAYNPAGTALMGEGFFIDVSNQTLLKYYSQDVTYDNGTEEVADETYKQSEPTILLPNVYAVYNAGQIGIGKLAAFAQMGVVAGGGTLVWDKGVAGLYDFSTLLGGADKLDVEVTGSSVYYSFGGGAAYSFLEDMVSVSAGAKYVIAKRTGVIDGKVKFADWSMDIDSEYEYDATGYTPVFGLDVRPMKELTLGVRYEMETALEFEYEQKKNKISTSNDNAFVEAVAAGALDKDGIKTDYNLPQILSVGAEYVAMPELTVAVNTNIYFLSSADMDKYEKYFGTGYEIGISGNYKVMDPLKVGGGFIYTTQAAKDKLLTEKEQMITVSGNPVLDSLMFCVGASYTVIPNLDITVAANWVHYLPEEDVKIDLGEGAVAEETVSYSKDVYTFALGASYKI